MSTVVVFSACTKNRVKLATDINAVVIYECTPKPALPYICFDSLLTDSRCPTGAECVRQGTALIKIRFHETAGTHNFIMSLKDYPSLGFTSDTTINRYSIIFTGLEPHPAINAPGSEKTTAYFSISR